jgi:hypothetical protein
VASAALKIVFEMSVVILSISSVEKVSRLSDDHPSTITWWKTCNQISGLKPSHYGIPPLLKNNNLIFNDLDKAFYEMYSDQQVYLDA